MTIGQLAKAANVNIETVRYYQRVNLLVKPPKPQAGYRRYSTNTLEQLLFIRRAKDLGFSLNDIRDLLMLRDKPNACADVYSATERILEDVQIRIRDLQNLGNTLVGLLNNCAKSPDCTILRALQNTP